MGLEHLDGEISRPMEPAEYRIGDMESERPVLSETPMLDISAEDLGNQVEGRLGDSERAAAELPHIEESKEQDIENPYLSSYEERLKQTPREDGERGDWSKERGESDFTPKNEEIKESLAEYGKESITYKDAIPDFSEVSEATVEIDDMTDNRADNFRQCDEKCAEQWNKEGRDGRTDWTARDVKEWRQENEYSWHERNDMKTCDLVPTKINDYFGHLGGVAECKKRDMENGGGDFDE